MMGVILAMELRSTSLGYIVKQGCPGKRMRLFRSQCSIPLIDPCEESNKIDVHLDVTIGNIRQSLPLRDQTDQIIEEDRSEDLLHLILDCKPLIFNDGSRIDNLVILWLVLFKAFRLALLLSYLIRIVIKLC